MIFWRILFTLWLFLVHCLAIIGLVMFNHYGAASFDEAMNQLSPLHAFAAIFWTFGITGGLLLWMWLDRKWLARRRKREAERV